MLNDNNPLNAEGNGENVNTENSTNENKKENLTEESQEEKVTNVEDNENIEETENVVQEVSDSKKETEVVEQTTSQEPTNEAQKEERNEVEAATEEQASKKMETTAEEIVAQTKVQETAANSTESTKEEEKPDKPSYKAFDPNKYKNLGFEEIIKESKRLMSSGSVENIRKEMVALRNLFREKMQEEEQAEKAKFLATGGQEVDFEYKNQHYPNFYKIYGDFKANLDQRLKQIQNEEKENLKIREQLIEELKNLYQGEFIGNSNIFNKFQEIKQAWFQTGRVPRANYKNISRTWQFHLNNFYKVLDLNKELREMNYDHHLEMRRKIINRATQLVEETNIQKALNELQFLHKQWKEEAVPVAEEFREPTWQEFKALTEKIHARKDELNAERNKEQEENLNKKLSILESLNELAQNLPSSHKEWQKTIKSFDALRNEFKAIGFVPRNKNQELWSKYREITWQINHSKNDFYKSLKKQQQENLHKKEELLKIAKENVENDNWSESVDLYKKLQADWRKIGHVPYNVANKIWKEFRGYCDEFFSNFKNRHNRENPEFENNYDLKSELLEALQQEKFTDDKQEVLNRIGELKSTWKKLGKVPRAKMSINRDFEAFIQNVLSKFELNDDEKANLQIGGLIDEIMDEDDSKRLQQEVRSTKNQLDALDAELRQLETNLNFFSNANDDNPLLQESFKQIEHKRKQITDLEIKLRKLQSLKIEKEQSSVEDSEKE